MTQVASDFGNRKKAKYLNDERRGVEFELGVSGGFKTSFVNSSRFKPSGNGDVVTLKINKASLIHVRESLGGSNDDDVFSLDFDVDVLSANSARNVQVVNTMRQRRDVTIADSVKRKQLDFFARSIAEFDAELVAAVQN